MFLVLTFLIVLTLGLLAQNLRQGRPAVGPILGRPAGSWGAPPTSDPRVAAAAMIYAVASEDGTVTREKTEQIVSLLSSTLDLTASEAQMCLANGKTLSRRLDAKV